MSILSEELKSSQFQTLRFKRERDSYKQMLDSTDLTPKKGNYNNQNNDNQVHKYINIINYTRVLIISSYIVETIIK